MLGLDPDTGWRIAILVGLLGLSAFFSGSETALMAFNRIRLRRLADAGDVAARRISRLVESPSRLLTTLLVGNNLVNTAISAIATALVLDWVVDERTALLVSTLAATTVILLVGEITPKALAAHAPESVARRVHRPVEALVWLLGPINRLLGAGADLLLRAMGHHRRQEASVSEEDVRALLTLGQQQGVFAPEEQRMVERIFAFGDLRVRDVMVPRVDVVGIPREITWPELLALVRREHFTRYPVYEGDLDHIIGILHVKELMLEAARHQAEAARAGAARTAASGDALPASEGQAGQAEEGRRGGERPVNAVSNGDASTAMVAQRLPPSPPAPVRQAFDITRFIRPAFFVPESKRVVELLREMRQQRAHMAIVVDEFGGTAGIVTIEDLVEEVVGDIADEFDHQREPAIRRLDERSFSVAGTVRLEELNEYLGIELTCEEADTVAGLVMTQLGRIPVPGDRTEQNGVELTVERMDGNRVERVQVRLPRSAAQADSPSGDATGVDAPALEPRTGDTSASGARHALAPRSTPYQSVAGPR